MANSIKKEIELAVQASMKEFWIQQRCKHEVKCVVSLQAKAFSIHDGKLQSVCQLLLALVRGQQQGVEAGVRCWQLVAVSAVSLNNTAEVSQTTNGRSVTAGEKLEKAPLLFIIHYLPDNLPQPLHNLREQMHLVYKDCHE